MHWKPSRKSTAPRLSPWQRATESTRKGELSAAISGVLIKFGSENDFDVISDNFDKMRESE